MAELHTHQHQAAVQGGETPSTNMDHVSASNEADSSVNVSHPEGSAPSGSTNEETKNDCGADMGQADINYGNSAEEKMVPLTETSSSPDEASPLALEENSTPPQADDRSHGDYHRVTPCIEQPIIESHPGEKRASETTPPPILDDRNQDQVDGPNTRLDEEIGTNIAEAAEDDGSGLEIHENTTSPQPALQQEMSDEEEINKQKSKVETLYPSTREIIEPAVPVVTGGQRGSRRYLITVVVGVVLAMLVQHLLQSESPPQKEDVRQTDIFLGQLEKLKTQFPNQRPELWMRSRIHLLRHLQTAQPTEPVSLILTAGIRAEQTLHCMAHGLASAFSSARNASVLHIDGASKASQDSDQVKLDIDSKLQGAFEGDKPVAVIHRFEELPPGSTLIFYRYCDHENAAYKKTFLIFTVLLGDEEIPAQSRLSTVEEMVDDHLKKKFLSAGHPVSFDRMDLDKYGGLWSRISHLILPVTTETRIELQGC